MTDYTAENGWDYRLYVVGEGVMAGFKDADSTYWKDYTEKITELDLSYGISTLPDNAFSGLTALADIEFGYGGNKFKWDNGVKTFGSNVFGDAPGTATNVTFSTVEEYEYDWASTERATTMVATLSALQDVLKEVEVMEENELPSEMWEELQTEIPVATALVNANSTDAGVITASFTKLYNLLQNRIVASYVVSIPAEVAIATDAEDSSKMTGDIPFSVKYIFPSTEQSLDISVAEESLSLTENNTGEVIPLSCKITNSSFDIDSLIAEKADDGFWYGDGNIALSTENRAGSWTGVIKINFGCVQSN